MTAPRWQDARWQDAAIALIFFWLFALALVELLH